MNLSCLRLAPALLMGSLATPALADFTYKNASGGSVIFGAGLNPSYMVFDDGVQSQGVIADNAVNNGFVSVNLSQPLGNGLSFGVNFYSYLGTRSSDTISQDDIPKLIHWTKSEIETLDVSLSGGFGTIYAGQGEMASYDALNPDYGLTTNVTEISFPSDFGGYFLRNADGSLSGVTIYDVFSNMGYVTAGRVRYDSPGFGGGFTVKASWGTDIVDKDADAEYVDAALSYEGTLASGRFSAAIATMRTEEGGTSQTQTYGAASYLAPNNVFVTLAAGTQGGDGRYGYGKVGYNASWWSAGTTALAVDYYRGEDFVTPGSESASYGIGLSQFLSDGTVELYAAYRGYSYAEQAAAYLDASSVIFGVAYTF